MLNRRDFLKKSTFIFTGAVFVPLSGIIRPSRANWWAHQGGGGAGSSYANWDGVTEADLVDGSDGSNIIIIAKMENTLIGNETGKSGTGVAGSALVLTQVNSVPGATGTGAGLNRVLTPGSTHYFTVLAGLTDSFNGLNDWTIIFRGKDIGNLAANAYFSYLHHAVGSSEFIDLKVDADNKLSSSIYANNDYNLTTALTTDAIATTGDFWIVAGCDGTTTFAGYLDSGSTGSGAHGQPTTWADFNANDRRSNARAEAFTSAFTNRSIYNISAGSTASGGQYYMLFAKTCLISGVT